MPEFHGVVRLPEEALYRVAKRGHELGWQLGVHAIGDGAVQMSVNVMERILRESPRDDHRHYLHHFSVKPPEETFEKMAELGIMVASQPAFMYWFTSFTTEVLQGEKEQTNNPQQSILDHGIPLSYGSDGAPTDPRVQLWAAVNRRGWDGKIYGADEAVTVEEAIRAHTMGTAYMNFDEDVKGSLEVGKFADMVVLGEDILTIDPDQIKDLTIERTIIGGKEVYSAPQLASR
jgi:predicted amidohydrolase YtcJ